MPVLRLADAYSGVMIPVGNEDAVETELKWKDNTYTVSAVETTSWEDDDWNDGWYPDPSGDGERLNSRLDVKMVVSIDNAYDGLVLVLAPIIDAKGSNGEFIMDLWTDDSYLFNVEEMSASFVAIADAEGVEENDADETEASAEKESKEESKAEAKSAETTTPKEEHTHNFTSTDTPSTCTVAGTRTFICNCGYSYSESLGLADHNYVESTQEIYHEEVWTRTPRTVTTKSIQCGCGERFSTNDEFQNHCAARIEAGYFQCGGSFWVDETQETVYDDVKQSDAWTETITIYTCSICGKTK